MPANPSYKQLQQRVRELEGDNEILSDKLDTIMDIVEDPDDESEFNDDDEGDEDPDTEGAGLD